MSQLLTCAAGPAQAGVPFPQPGLCLLQMCGRGPWPHKGLGTPLRSQGPGAPTGLQCPVDQPPGPRLGAHAGERVLPLFLFEKRWEQ